ncbi:MAG: CPBP family intramembrane metalloprotease [Bacteroidetes bacterium]|nr:CPBP family intramembrane metalloprotease [Bacteroidota bacterium]
MYDKTFKNDFFDLSTFLGLLLIFNIIGSILSLCLFGNLFSDLNHSKDIAQLNNINFDSIYKLKLITSLNIKSFFTFVLSPLFYIYFSKRNYSFKLAFFNYKKLIFIILLITIILILIGIINIYLINFAKKVSFARNLYGLKIKAKFIDFKINYIIKNLSNSTSFTHFLYVAFSCAFLPAIGEELTFRLIIQNDLNKILNNIHLAILFTSIFFSISHLQISLILPRILISLILGYFYYWSKTIFIPILAHFINNFLFFSLVYLKNLKYIDLDLFEHNKQIPSFVIFISLVFLFYLSSNFKKIITNKF